MNSTHEIIDNPVLIFSGCILFTYGIRRIVKIISYLTRETHTLNTKYKNELLNSNCTICLEDFVEGEKVVTIKHCRHTFHPKCFQNWITTKHTCPNCQYQIPV